LRGFRNLCWLSECAEAPAPAQRESTNQIKRVKGETVIKWGEWWTECRVLRTSKLRDLPKHRRTKTRKKKATAIRGVQKVLIARCDCLNSNA
jgi:hypothetical protein